MHTYLHPCTYTHNYIYIHIYIHMCIHKCTYIHTCIHMCIHSHTCLSKYSCSCIHTHLHQYTFMLTHIHTFIPHTYIHVSLCTHPYTLTFMHIHTYIHKCICTYIHALKCIRTYIHAHTYIITFISIYTYILYILCPLQAGDTVTIQNPLNHRWNTTGKIISILPERQYKIRVDGSRRITLRNRRFLKKCKLKPAPTPIPSATIGPTIPSTNATVTRPPLPPCNSTYTATRPQQQTTHITPRLRSSRIPRALSRLLPHNKPGVKERQTSHTTRPTCGGGGEM